MSLGGEIKGTAYETRDVAQDYLLPFSQTLGNYGSTNLQDYSGWLNRLTSEDPNARFAAVAPQVGDITAQTEAVKRQIAELPRGGERNYLTAEADISKAGNIGELLTKLYTMAQQEKGGFGKWSSQAFMSGLGEFGNLENTAATILEGRAGPEAASKAAAMKTIGQIAAAVAMAF